MRFQSELKDSSEFEAWKRKMAAMDGAHRAQVMAKLKEDAARAAQEAVAAVQRKIAETHEKVEQQREVCALLFFPLPVIMIDSVCFFARVVFFFSFSLLLLLLCLCVFWCVFVYF